MIISCVYRAQKSGYHLSRSMAANVLVGSKRETILRMGLDQLSTYGLMSKLTRREVQDWIDELVAQENLALRPFADYQELALTAGSVAIIRDEKKVMHRVPIVQEKLAAPAGTVDPTLSEADNALFQQLRELRTKLARNEGVPIFYLFGCDTPGYVPQKARFHAGNAAGFRCWCDQGAEVRQAVPENTDGCRGLNASFYEKRKLHIKEQVPSLGVITETVPVFCMFSNCCA